MRAYCLHTPPTFSWWVSRAFPACKQSMSSEALDALEDPWGQLVSIEQEEEERVPVLGSQFTIGRGKGEIELFCTCGGWSLR